MLIELLVVAGFLYLGFRLVRCVFRLLVGALRLLVGAIVALGFGLRASRTLTSGLPSAPPRPRSSNTAFPS